MKEYGAARMKVHYLTSVPDVPMGCLEHMGISAFVSIYVHVLRNAYRVLLFVYASTVGLVGDCTGTSMPYRSLMRSALRCS